MDFSKIKNKMLIILCVFVVILPFFLITFTYATEPTEVTVSTTDGIVLSYTGYFVSADNFTTYYFPIEKGYSYTVNLKAYNTGSADGNIRTGFANVISAGERVYNYATFTNDYTFTFTSDDYDYFFFSFANISGGNTIDYTITREPYSSMNSSVDKLVNNVGIDSIWNIFDISVNYIVVVVLFAFGCYIIFGIIRKISRGKEGL